MKNVLITGCAGFIGSTLAEVLLSEGYKVTGIDNFDNFYSKQIKKSNLQNFINNKLFNFYEINICDGLHIIKEEIDIVIHLAAKAGVRPSIANPSGYIENNITGTQQVLEFMNVRRIKKLIFASSSSVYGNNKNIPFRESDDVDNPISPYAFTKKACELLTYTYHHLYKIDVINLRLFTVYGPRQRPDLAIYKFVKSILNDKPIEIYGEGNTARDYTYVLDIVQGFYNSLKFILENKDAYLTLNLGNNNPVMLIDLVNVIYKKLNRQPMLIYKPMQAGDVDITYADISQAKNIINYQPKIDMEEGIGRFISWYQLLQINNTLIIS
ncbi:MAG: GDP-mannose 4,6-dehydratase [Ginsengibacter sp.]